jgi:hypothetical protein
MKTLFAAVTLVAASIAGVAIAQNGALPPQGATVTVDLSSTIQDAKGLYPEAQVNAARRAYRAACDRYESTGFCECVTAGVAQALAPSNVRLAARTIGERIRAEGSAPGGYETDARIIPENPRERIAQVEGHYADACRQFRGS